METPPVGNPFAATRQKRVCQEIAFAQPAVARGGRELKCQSRGFGKQSRLKEKFRVWLSPFP
jgi:hypothetical protein